MLVELQTMSWNRLEFNREQVWICLFQGVQIQTCSLLNVKCLSAIARLTPRSGKLNKICEREVEMYLER